jgi:hypothetical protein
MHHPISVLEREEEAVTAGPARIWRATAADAERINDWVWRDSGFRPDFTAFLEEPLNVCLVCGEGGALFVWRGPDIYEVHVFFEERGKAVLKLSHEMLEIMREEFGARIFWAAVPVESRHVIMFTRLMGWKSQGVAMQPQGKCEIFLEDSACHQQ